eukprot:scaffold2128_cov371-Prasinococcus_capsulatus_cf.AAC.1
MLAAAPAPLPTRGLRSSPRKCVTGPAGASALAARFSTRRAAVRAAVASADVEEVDVVVIGAGLGGLSAAALLARYGLSVKVCESHTIAGGAAHEFVRDGYHFECGPSLYSGMTAQPRYAPFPSDPRSSVRLRSRGHAPAVSIRWARYFKPWTRIWR